MGKMVQKREGAKETEKPIFMHVDEARSPESPRTGPPKWVTFEGGREYPLVNSFVYPRNIKKLLAISVVASVFLACDFVLLICFVTLSLIRRFLQLTGMIKYRVYRRGEVGPARDVSDKRVCVVGCGSSALAFAKECKEQGMDFKAYDAGPCLGGLYACWAYESGQLTTSNFFTAFGSFPCSKDDLPCRTTPFKEYVDYLGRFADFYKLRPFMHFNTAVTKIEDRPDGKWNIYTKKNGSDEETVEVYTNVVVANGINRYPNIPDIPNRDKFKGRVMHSSEYRSASDLAGKRVMVVGLGESGSDICLEIAPKAKEMLITTRQGPGAVLTRYHAAMPNDVETSIAYHSMPRRFWLNPLARGPSHGALPLWWRTKIWIEKAFNLSQDDDEICDCKAIEFTKYHWMCRAGTKTTGFLKACSKYGAKYKECEIKSYDAEGVLLSDGTRYDCDAIMFCTGFKREMSMMPPDLHNLHYRNDLWRKTIHPKYGDRLAFLGFTRPAIGAIPPIAEMAGRYTALMMAGRLPLHSNEQMQKDIKEDIEYDEWLFPYDAKRLPGIASHFETWVQWQKEVGTNIRWLTLLFTDPLLFHRLLFCQLIPAQGRIFGYGSDYKEARKAVTLTGMVPVHVQCIKTFLLLTSCCAAQLGLTDTPYSFNHG